MHFIANLRDFILRVFQNNCFLAFVPLVKFLNSLNDETALENSGLPQIESETVSLPFSPWELNILITFQIKQGTVKKLSRYQNT